MSQEFEAHLHTVFAISTSNDIINTHPPSATCAVCWHKIAAHTIHQYIPFECKQHTTVDCEVQ